MISIGKDRIIVGSRKTIYIGDCTKYTGKAIKEGSYISWSGKTYGKLIYAHIINCNWYVYVDLIVKIVFLLINTLL